MSSQDIGGIDFNFSWFEFQFIKDVDLSKRSTCGDEICFGWMMSNPINFIIDFNLMLDDYFIFDAIFILTNGLSRLEWLCVI